MGVIGPPPAFSYNGQIFTGPSADGSNGDVLITDGSGTTSFTTFQEGREVLEANRTYYVRTDGSDSNDGLTNSSGGAFLTIQKAIDVAATLDLSTFNVTIKLGNTGTYAGADITGSFIGGPGSYVELDGDTTSPSSYVLSSQIFMDGLGVYFQIKGVDFTSSNYAVQCLHGAFCRITGAVIFGACTSGHVLCHQVGLFFCTQNYTIDGNTFAHVICNDNSFAVSAGNTITLTGTPAWSSAFAVTLTCGVFQANGITFSGSATGKRYDAQLNSVIRTLTGNVNYFPGNVAGTTATGGQYN